MKPDDIRVMHGLSPISGQDSYSVQGLRQIGVKAECTVYYPNPAGYPYDKCLGVDKRKRLLYPWYVLKLGAFLLQALFRYNTFHFHFGHSIGNNAELWLYDLLGRQYFYEFHGSDLRDYARSCQVTGMPFDPADAMSPRMRRRNEKICRKAKGIILHDDELIPYLPDVCAPVYVVPLRVDTGRLVPAYPDADKRANIRIVHAPSRRAGKGTQYVLEAFGRLKKKYDFIELVLVEGKSQPEALEIYRTADIIVDQLYIGTYGVFAIEGMCLGKPVITRISEEMRRRLPPELPIQDGGVGTLETTLERLILNGPLRRELGMAGRKYAETYHDYRVGAYLLRDIYEGKAVPMTGRAAFARAKEVKETYFNDR